MYFLFQKRYFSLIFFPVFLLSFPVNAASLHSQDVRHFSAEDFCTASLPPDGIFILSTPSSCGSFTLGMREILPGDVLTIEQAEQLVFSPDFDSPGTCSLSFLPISDGTVGTPLEIHLLTEPPSDQIFYADTQNLPCAQAASWLHQAGIFTGEQIAGRWCFQPDKPVTKGEFLVMMMDILRLPVERSVPADFSDVPFWISPYLSAAVHSGIIQLNENRHFSEHSILFEKEAQIMSRRALEYAIPASAIINGTDILDAFPVFSSDMVQNRPVTRANVALMMRHLHELRISSCKLAVYCPADS